MSLAILLDMVASGLPDRAAFGSGADQVTFAQLRRLAGGGAAVLREHPVGHVVLLGRNGPNLPHVLFSATHAGLPFTPLNYRLGTAQLAESLAGLDRPFVIADEDYLPFVAGHGPSMTTAQFRSRSAATSPSQPVEVDDSAPAVMLFTSGTTAKPKIVPLRHENLVSYVLGTVEFGAADERDAALVTVPPYHVAAIGSALSNLYAGRRVAHLPDFTARAWLDLVANNGITSAMVVPTMLSRIVEELDGAQAEAPALRSIAYGGARMPRPVLEKALRAFPGCDFVNAYGLTETSSTIAILGPEDHRASLASDDETVRARLGSAGRPIPGIELAIRDANGHDLPPGAAGELWVRGPQISGEYVGIGSVLDADGWFPTRDRAWLDRDGYVFVDGRADDTIIRGGENISPAEIEDTLSAHPGVLDVAVIGIDDDEWGQRLVAVVVRRPGIAGTELTAEGLRAWARARLRGSRTPDAVVWRAELPYTPTGKLLRRDVITDVAAELTTVTGA